MIAQNVLRTGVNVVGDSGKQGQGGFMAVLHSLEEQFYGPEMKLNASALKILLYIRHRALRDWTTRKQIPKSEILKATGIRPTTAKEALRELEKQGFVLVTRTKNGKTWEDNIYELHPKRFGTDYIYRPEKPTFRLIHGSKHKSNPGKLSPEKTELSPAQGENDDIGRETALAVGSTFVPDVGRESDLGDTSNHLELLTNPPPKNPLKNPLKELFPKSMNLSGEMGPQDLDARLRFLKQQAAQLREEAEKNKA